MRLAAQAKGGFYPTPPRVVDLIAELIHTPSGSYNRGRETLRILDPCCGAGEALAQLAERLDRPNAIPIETYGVELHRDRAQEAEERLDHALASDLFATSIANGAFGLLLLNPPYQVAYDDFSRHRCSRSDPAETYRDCMLGYTFDHASFYPWSSAYDNIRLAPGGAAARQSRPGWASWHQVWPTATGGARGASEDFDVSGVNVTNFPDIECVRPHNTESCGKYKEYSAFGIAGWHGSAMTYIQVKAGPGEETNVETALREEFIRRGGPGADGGSNTVIIPVKYDYQELWRWQLILNRFALSSGNTIGITGAVVSERDLHKVQMEEDRAIRLFVSDKITEDQLDHQRRFITERLESLRDKLDKHRAQQSMANEKRVLMENLFEWAGKFREGLDDLSSEERRNVLLLLVDQVLIDRDNNVNITLAIPTKDLVSIASLPLSGRRASLSFRRSRILRPSSAPSPGPHPHQVLAAHPPPVRHHPLAVGAL